ncbi:MAG: hypothetical protein QXY86_02665 [Candidatus Micrarchaeaceae archaeon]
MLRKEENKDNAIYVNNAEEILSVVEKYLPTSTGGCDCVEIRLVNVIYHIYVGEQQLLAALNGCVS